MIYDCNSMTSFVNLIAVYLGISAILLIRENWLQKTIFKRLYDKLTGRARQIEILIECRFSLPKRT